MYKTKNYAALPELKGKVHFPNFKLTHIWRKTTVHANASIMYNVQQADVSHDLHLS